VVVGIQGLLALAIGSEHLDLFFCRELLLDRRLDEVDLERG
jgi:hypothetical protein